MDILQRILDLREKRNWTEYKLSIMSDISQSTISSWYSKNRYPSIVSLEKICNGFDITLSQFFSESEALSFLTQNDKVMLAKWGVLSQKEKERVLTFINWMK